MGTLTIIVGLLGLLALIGFLVALVIILATRRRFSRMLAISAVGSLVVLLGAAILSPMEDADTPPATASTPTPVLGTPTATSTVTPQPTPSVRDALAWYRILITLIVGDIDGIRAESADLLDTPAIDNPVWRTRLAGLETQMTRISVRLEEIEPPEIADETHASLLLATKNYSDAFRMITVLFGDGRASLIDPYLLNEVESTINRANANANFGINLLNELTESHR